MISNLFPGLISPFSPHTAFFYRASGSGLADNYVRGQTIAEMFSLPTTYPIYLTVVIPSSCLIYDFYGLHEEDGQYTYSLGSGGAGALRLDDLHEDSLVVILNNGEISGAGGDGGMGEIGYSAVSGNDYTTLHVGSGGGGGRGRAGTMGGMRGDGGTWPIYARLGYFPYRTDPDRPVPMTVLDGTDGDEDGPGSGGGTRDSWNSDRASGVWNETSDNFYPHAANLQAFITGFADWPGETDRPDWQHEYGRSNDYGWFQNHPIEYGYTIPTPCCPYTDIWKAQFTNEITPEIPGYISTNKALFVPQPGTAAIVLGCKTYIHNSEASGKEGYIYGGGGGGVGGDREVGTGFGFAGGDWGTQGEGPNHQGHDGGLGGKAVELNGNELEWLAGELQIEGGVS